MFLYCHANNARLLVVAVVVVGKHNFFSRYFGIQFYGECWGDVEAEARYAMHGEVDRKHSEQNCIEGEIQNLQTFSSLNEAKLSSFSNVSYSDIPFISDLTLCSKRNSASTCRIFGQKLLSRVKLNFVRVSGS